MKTFKEFMEQTAKDAWNALPGDKPKKPTLTQAFYKLGKDPGERDYVTPKFNPGFSTINKGSYKDRMKFKLRPVR